MLIRIFDLFTVVYSCLYLGLFLTNYSFIAPAGINNIAGPTGGLAAILAIRYFADRRSFAANPVAGAARRIIDSFGLKTCLVICGLLFAVLTAVSVARHFAFSSGASDLGIFDQAVWNSAQGRILFSSLKGGINLLGDHFEPVLLLFAPLYRLWPSALVLLIGQSLLLALAVFPLYLIAKDRLSSKALILALLVAYGVSRPLRGAAFSDFHPECFILLFSFWAYYSLIKRKNGLLVIAVLFMLASKEDAAFLVSALGLYAAAFEKRRALGSLLFAAGIIAWIAETKFVIAHFSPTGAYPYMNRLPFGLTYGDNIRSVVHDPTLLGKIFFDKAKIAYCIKFFAPLAFLPLLSPRHYILIAVPLLRNILPVDPNFSGHYNITSHYTASVIPFVFIAAIYGAGNLARWIKNTKASSWIAALVVLVSLFYYGKTDAYKFRRFTQTVKQQRTIEKLSYLRQIPPDVSVSSNFNLVPHLSQRKYIFEWNPRTSTGFSSQYLVIDMTLLEYLSKEDVAVLGPYLAGIEGVGYKKIFNGLQGTFLIYHKP